MALSFPILLVAGAAFLSSPSAGAAGPPRDVVTEGQKEAPQADDLMAQADKAFKARQYDEALKLYKKANAATKDQSPDALWGMALAYNALNAQKSVAQTLEKYVPLVKDDPEREAQAHNLRGQSVWNAAVLSSDIRKFTEAEPHFRRALEVSPNLAIAHFNLANVLFKRSADPEGIEQLKLYLEKDPNGPSAADARRLMENPRRAREEYAAEFSATTAEGERISLVDLKGKVVVLDFWATWCGPCKQALPTLKRIVKRSASEPVVTISISSDQDQQKWRAFIAENEMTWQQVHDSRGLLNRAYSVRGIPTYIVIDHEGIIRERIVGYSPVGDGGIEGAIRKALKAAKAGPAK